MPVTIGGVSGALLPSIGAANNLGVGVPQLAAGIANGVCQWTPQIVVLTVDVGAAGVGSGGPLPVTISGALVATMVTNFAAFQLRGSAAVSLATGIANGLIMAYTQGLIKTTHAGVGTGSGVATFRAPVAGPTLMAGLKSAGLFGSAVDRLALAVGQALDTTFASLVIPIQIVGPSTPTSASGVGVGNII